MKVITIEGATASGKSDLAFRLAKYLDTEIISADSRQVYKYLDIGTAKPDQQTLSEVRHHIVSIITPDMRYSAGAFLKDATAIIHNLHILGKIPIICGGTMLYIQSLLYGLSEIPDIPMDAVSRADEYMKDHTLAQCFDHVMSFDPKFASKISKTDKQRISRALEVWYAFGKPLTDFWAENTLSSDIKPYKIFVNPDREELYRRINTRMLQMIKNGLLEEIQFILKMGYTKNDYGLNTVGYKEFLDFDSDTAIEKAAQHTRNYAKRQLTWYKKCEFDLVINDVDKFNIKSLDIKN